MEGYKATTKLLKGAHPLSQAKRTTSFWKSGDYSTAMADFKGVDPSDVHDMALPAGVSLKPCFLLRNTLTTGI